jgi:hypothetical protein
LVFVQTQERSVLMSDVSVLLTSVSHQATNKLEQPADEAACWTQAVMHVVRGGIAALVGVWACALAARTTARTTVRRENMVKDEGIKPRRVRYR